MVTSGKDKGKSGKVIKVYSDDSRVLVEGINLAKKHIRRTQENQQGGVIQIERPIFLSNVMPFCKTCDRPVKVGFATAKDNAKSRFCKRCKQPI
jgi:large subunit ribosomal protein L24